MRDWYANLEIRERVVLVVGAAAAVLMILYLAAWRPLMLGTVRLEAAVQEKRELVADLQRAAAIAPAGTPAAPAGASQSLVVLVDQTAQAAGLASAFTATRPDGRDAINVSFQNAAFDALVEWLLVLEAGYGIRVESASFNEASRRGLVSGQLLLMRGS